MQLRRAVVFFGSTFGKTHTVNDSNVQKFSLNSWKLEKRTKEMSSCGKAMAMFFVRPDEFYPLE